MMRAVIDPPGLFSAPSRCKADNVVRVLSAWVVCVCGVQWLRDDNDGYSVYAVKLLKGAVKGAEDPFLDGFKKACQEKRYTLRLWTPPAETKQGAETLQNQLVRVEAWCTRRGVHGAHHVAVGTAIVGVGREGRDGARQRDWPVGKQWLRVCV